MKISISVLIINNINTSASCLINKLNHLCQWNPHIRTCNNEDEATDIILKYQPDVVFVYSGLNGKDCMNVIKNINEMKCDTTVIFIMDVHDYILAFDAIINGAADYLVRNKLTIDNLDQSLSFIIERNSLKNTFYFSKFKSGSISKSLSDVVIHLKNDGTIISWSKGAEEVFGYERNEMLGNSILCIIPENLKEDYLSNFKSVISPEKAKIVKTFKLNTLRKDGSELACGFSISSWRNKKEIYYTAVLTEREYE